jgi:hypothetical protein
MSPEIVFIDTYSCPQCRAELETGYNEWQGWQRCPSCGLPSLPPEPVPVPSPARLGAGQAVRDDLLVISDVPENLAMADPALAGVESQSSYVSGARLILRTGLLVSVGLTFIFFLDHRTTNMVIFAFLSFVFFLLLVRMPGRSRPTS